MTPQERRNKYRFALLVADPAKHERWKAYQREWDRRRSAAKPDRTATCICGASFVLNRAGRPRRYCRECAAFYTKDRKSVAYRKWYRKNHARQVMRMAEYRERMRRAA